MNGRSLTEGTPWKLILEFAFPVLAGTLLQQLYNTVDTIVVGNFAGEDALSAVGTTGSFGFLFLALAIGFSAGCGVLVAQYYGAGNEERIRRTASTGIILLLGMAAAVTILSLVSSRAAFVHILLIPDHLLEMSLSYFYIYALGMVFQFGYNIIASILRALGDSRSTLYFLLIASVINILLDLLFVAVFGMGAAGAAAATDIAQAASFAAAVIYMFKKYPMLRFKREDMVYDRALAARTVSIGFPMALQMVFVSIGFTLIQRAVNSYGQSMIASFTVAQRLETYMNMPANAFQTTMATYTGQNIGAGKMDRVKSGVRQTLIMSFCFTLFISVIVFLLSDSITGIFGISGQAAAYCSDHLRATAVCMLIISLYFPLFGVFQGAGHGGAPTLVALCALTTRVICTYTLNSPDMFGYSIIWWNQLFGFSVGITVAWSYYFSGRWKRRASVVE